MDPMLIGTMLPQTDPMGMFRLLQMAMSNPEQGAQLLAGMGMEPPNLAPAGESTMDNPFAMSEGQTPLDPGMQGPTQKGNPVRTIPGMDVAAPQPPAPPPLPAMGNTGYGSEFPMIPGSPPVPTGTPLPPAAPQAPVSSSGIRIGLPRGPQPTPQPMQPPAYPDYGQTPTSPGMGEFTMPSNDPISSGTSAPQTSAPPMNFGAGPKADPFTTYAAGPAVWPAPPTASQASTGGPAQATGNMSNPFPTPYGQATGNNGNPFPTPIGTPPGADKMSGLTNALKGISVPSAPEPQRVSSPGIPPQGSAATDSGLVALLTKMLSGQNAPLQHLRLGQTIPMPPAAGRL